MRPLAGRPCLRALRARSRPVLAAILPALLLRALIPFGFMPVAGSGGPAMQLCPGAVAGVQHHHGGAPADGTAHAVCAFAASAAPAVAPVAPPMPLQAADIRCRERQCVSSARLPSILRAQSARAPPSLA